MVLDFPVLSHGTKFKGIVSLSAVPACTSYIAIWIAQYNYNSYMNDNSFISGQHVYSECGPASVWGLSVYCLNYQLRSTHNYEELTDLI